MDKQDMSDSKFSRSESFLDELILERRKTIAYCMNLECKNEQLKILIEKLHKLSNLRENQLLTADDQEIFSKEVDQLYISKISICEEMEIAKKDSERIENTILELKNKLNCIDSRLK